MEDSGDYDYASDWDFAAPNDDKVGTVSTSPPEKPPENFVALPVVDDGTGINDDFCSPGGARGDEKEAVEVSVAPLEMDEYADDFNSPQPSITIEADVSSNLSPKEFECEVEGEPSVGLVNAPIAPLETDEYADDFVSPQLSVNRAVNNDTTADVVLDGRANQEGDDNASCVELDKGTTQCVTKGKLDTLSVGRSDLQRTTGALSPSQLLAHKTYTDAINVHAIKSLKYPLGTPHASKKKCDALGNSSEIIEEIEKELSMGEAMGSNTSIQEDIRIVGPHLSSDEEAAKNVALTSIKKKIAVQRRIKHSKSRERKLQWEGGACGRASRERDSSNGVIEMRSTPDRRLRIKTPVSKDKQNRNFQHSPSPLKSATASVPVHESTANDDFQETLPQKAEDVEVPIVNKETHEGHRDFLADAHEKELRLKQEEFLRKEAIRKENEERRAKKHEELLRKEAIHQAKVLSIQRKKEALKRKKDMKKAKDQEMIENRQKELNLVKEQHKLEKKILLEKYRQCTSLEERQRQGIEIAKYNYARNRAMVQDGDIMALIEELPISPIKPKSRYTSPHKNHPQLEEDAVLSIDKDIAVQEIINKSLLSNDAQVVARAERLENYAAQHRLKKMQENKELRIARESACDRREWALYNEKAKRRLKQKDVDEKRGDYIEYLAAKKIKQYADMIIERTDRKQLPPLQPKKGKFNIQAEISGSVSARGNPTRTNDAPGGRSKERRISSANSNTNSRCNLTQENNFMTPKKPNEGKESNVGNNSETTGGKPCQSSVSINSTRSEIDTSNLAKKLEKDLNDQGKGNNKYTPKPPDGSRSGLVNPHRQAGHKEEVTATDEEFVKTQQVHFYDHSPVRGEKCDLDEFGGSVVSEDNGIGNGGFHANGKRRKPPGVPLKSHAYKALDSDSMHKPQAVRKPRRMSVADREMHEVVGFVNIVAAELISEQNLMSKEKVTKTENEGYNPFEHNISKLPSLDKDVSVGDISGEYSFDFE